MLKPETYNMQNNDELFLPHEWTEVLALINKNRKGPITGEEEARLNSWIEKSEENKMLFEKNEGFGCGN